MQPSEPGRIRVLIVDDHQVVRLGLRALLERQTGFEVVGEAGSVVSAIEEAQRLRPDVVLLDVRLPDGKGYEACRQIHQRVPDVRVLFLTSFADEQTVLESLDAGGDGYLLKEIDESALVRAVCSVAAGQSILDPAITRRVLERARTPAVPTGEAKWASLSPQEKRVLSLVAEGKTNKEIGLGLGLSDKTVKNYLSNLLEKLQLTRRSQAAAFFVQFSPKAGQ